MACDMSCSRPSTALSCDSPTVSASAEILEGLSTSITEGAQVQVSRRRLAESGNAGSVVVMPLGEVTVRSVVVGLATPVDARGALAALTAAPGTLDCALVVAAGGAGLRALISSSVIRDCTG